MHWDAYTVFSVVSGVALLALAALFPELSGRQRLGSAAAGVSCGGYGLWVAHQTSGVYFFSIWTFLLPIVVAIGLFASYRGRRNPAMAAPGDPLNYASHLPGPRCAEPVRRAATMCRFCGLDLTAVERPPLPAPMSNISPATDPVVGPLYESVKDVEADILATVADGVPPTEVEAYWRARHSAGQISDDYLSAALRCLQDGPRPQSPS
jgi:hypothetical protein